MMIPMKEVLCGLEFVEISQRFLEGNRFIDDVEQYAACI